MRRLRNALDAGPGLVVVFGRRRLGKSRLVLEALTDRPHLYYVGDARDAALQRRSLAVEAARVLPGFADVGYPDWESLVSRLWREAPGGFAVAIDELPELVARSPELPSILQKQLDGAGTDAPTCVVLGSSQRMMHGLVLDASAPLYGRASQVLKLEPLPAGWLGDALGLRSPSAVVEHHAAWGGVPRYWELARGRGNLFEALEEVALDPLSPLHREPERLLLDEVSDVTRPASILALVGRGCHRVSEIAGRLGVPATSLSRSLAQLVDLGFLRRDVPFGCSLRDTKRTFYRLADPFLRTWCRFVEPNRSRLGAGLADVVAREVQAAWPGHVGEHWEQLARDALPRLTLHGRRWNPPSRWWGRTRDRDPIELDLVADAVDADEILVGEAKRTCTAREARSALEALERKAAQVPPLAGRTIRPVIFVLRKKGALDEPGVVTAADVVDVLR
jgi:hypothetical protein